MNSCLCCCNDVRFKNISAALNTNVSKLVEEKIIELIRVNNEMPCVKFVLSSSDLIQTLAPNMPGVYTLAMNDLVGNKLVYLRKTPTELFALASAWNSEAREFTYWAVRYENENC